MAEPDLALERATLTALLDKYDGDDAWAQLAADGWLDLVPEGGTWGAAAVAAVVAAAAVESGRELGVGAHLAAAATTTELGATGHATSRLGVFTATRDCGNEVRGRLWAPVRPDRVVVALPGGALGVAAVADLVVAADRILPLRQVGVCEARVPRRDIEPLGNVDAGHTHEARVAWLLAVEALAAVANATRRTLDYTRRREAFGAPLARQQVVAHRLVDMTTVDLLGTALLRRAGHEWITGADPASSRAAVTLAASRGVWAVEQAIQLHGGIGFTHELGLGRALALCQRARALDVGRPAAVAHAAANRRLEIVDWSLQFRHPDRPEEAP